jgi:S-formylglutathione hydrolase FrmB
LKKKNKGCGVLSSSMGSSRVFLMARKSYANFDELRSFSPITRNSRVVGKKPVLRIEF